MTVSLMSFFNYVPYIIVSLFARTFVDNHSKKIVMLVSDSIAAVCSAAVLVLSIGNGLQIYHIYMVNFVIGFMNAFQGPASAVALFALDGFLADYVFEPFMMSKNAVSSVLHVLVGQGAGSGMAAMFLCTGVLGCLFSLVSYRQKEIQKPGQVL